MMFEVRSIDGERLVENTEIAEYEEDENTITAEFTIKDLIDADTEYMLVLLLKITGVRPFVIIQESLRQRNIILLRSCPMCWIFIIRTFDKESAKELTKYLESNAEGDNTTFSKVNIHSSFGQVTWGELQVERLTEPEITIKEMAAQTGSVELDYVVAIHGNNTQSLLQVKEFYRIRYTPDRIYLLDYERTMKQIFDENGESFANNKITLGITLENDLQLLESDGGNVFAFTDGNRLFSYNVTDQKLSRLFSFYDGNYEDLRLTWQKHGIRILNVDEAGNVQFIVYGYMSRGKHEGEVGIAVYQFSGLMNTVEELVYIPDDSSYEILDTELEQLAYISMTDTFFFMHDGTVYAVDLSNRTCEVMVSGLKEGSYKVSDSNRMFVWQMGENLHNCKN